MEEYLLKPIGIIRSELKDIDAAPKFYTDVGAPHARLELIAAYTDGVQRLQIGQDIIVITWLHLARRDVLHVHPQGNTAKPLTGVFLTRSPDRPNPLGLHRACVLGIEDHSLLIGPIEVVDGTPVIDIKPVVEEANDF